MVWLAVVLYSVAALALGWRAYRRAEPGAAYWTAGRDLSASSVGLSISAGFMSVSWSCVYAVQLFYWYGLGAIWLITIPWMLALGGIYLLARRYHALTAFSQPEMVGQRFGKGTRRVVALALAFVFLVWGGAEIYVAATLLAPGLHLSVGLTIVGLSVVVGGYATLGGFRAVVATDKMQYVIVACYVLAIGGLALNGMDEVAGTSWPPRDVLAAKSGRSWTALAAPGFGLILLGFIAYLPGWLFETDLWLRVQAARDGGSARKGMLMAGGNALFFVGLLPCFIGVAALVLFPMEGRDIPASLGVEGDAIFAALVNRYAPSWLAALVAVGLVAAAMSTIDTCANVMALSLAYDVLNLHERPDSWLRSSHVTALSVGAAGVFAWNTESLWDLFYLSGGVLTTAVAFPVAAVFWKGAVAKGIHWSAWAGFIGTVVAYFLESRAGLAALAPAFIAETGLGYILWGMLAAAAGYAAGAGWERLASAGEIQPPGT